MGRIRPLEIGKTKLGEISAMAPDGKYVNLSVYYGNYVYPMVGDEYQHQTQEAYIKLLKTFLDSEEGQQYLIPTQQEVNTACLVVANKEKEFMEKRDAERKRQEEQNRKQPTPQYIDANIVPPNVRDIYTKPKPEPEPEPAPIPPQRMEPQRRFEDDEILEEEEQGKKKKGFFGGKKEAKEEAPVTPRETDNLLASYKKKVTLLTTITAFLSVVIGFELVLNLFLLAS